MKKLTLATAVALVAGVLFVWAAGASAQTVVTSDPIQTVPGELGCGGNASIRDVTTDFSCANQRTFHFGPITRTVVARSTFRADGTATTTFTLTGGTAPADLKLRIVSHSGVSSSNGPVIDEVTGTMPKGTTGPVVLNYIFQCGQVDIKAILTGNGDSAGRISGPFVCTAPVVTPTTVPASVAPATTVAGATTSAPAVVPSTALTATAVGALPATGSDLTALFAAVVALLVGVTLIATTRRRSAS